MNSKFYNKHNKLKSGPGGWDCPCCNPLGCHPRNMKKVAKRLVRRKNKQELKNSGR